MEVSRAEGVKRPILASKVFLYVTEFVSGMAVMAAELGAQRLLAPYFSSSQIVWTIIIGTIMIALALGAVFGGRWADRDPDPDRMYMRVLVAAVWIALIPLVGKRHHSGRRHVRHVPRVLRAAACAAARVFPVRARAPRGMRG